MVIKGWCVIPRYIKNYDLDLLLFTQNAPADVNTRASEFLLYIVESMYEIGKFNFGR